jgi:hypothetical protein
MVTRLLCESIVFGSMSRVRRVSVSAPHDPLSTVIVVDVGYATTMALSELNSLNPTIMSRDPRTEHGSISLGVSILRQP